MSVHQPPKNRRHRPLIDVDRVRPSSGRSQLWEDFGSGWTMVCELLAATFTWGGIGWLADRLLGIEPWLMSLGFLVGSAAGFYLVYIRATRAMEIQERLRAGKSAVEVVVDRVAKR